MSVKTAMESLVFKSAGIEYKTYGKEHINPRRSKEARKIEDRKIRAAMRSDLVKLYSSATDSIIIVSGAFPDFVYADMQILGAVLEARKQALGAGRSFKIEVVTGPKPGRIALEEWRSQGIDVKVLDEWPEWHFSLVDGKRVKLEDRHTRDSEKGSQYIITHDYGHVDEMIQELDRLEKMPGNTRATRI